MEDDRTSIQRLEEWSASLGAIAQTGLAFTDSLYERERYEEILKVVARMRQSAGALEDSATIVSDLLYEVRSGVPGYVTPKCAVGAVVVDSDRRVLLVRRSDSGIWLYPTGWADVGYSPAEVVVKEVLEETGIQVRPTRLLGVADGMRRGFTSVPMYSLLFLCVPTGGSLQGHPLETIDVGWFGADELPHSAHGLLTLPWLSWIFDASTIPPEPFFDLPRPDRVE
ncbi:MAG: NUDIX hydrolase N-terminal domain-containing protein [Ferrimicrobium sp.]